MKKALHFFMITPVVVFVAAATLGIIGLFGWAWWNALVNYIGMPIWAFIAWTVGIIWVAAGIMYIKTKMEKDAEEEARERIKNWEAKL